MQRVNEVIPPLAGTKTDGQIKVKSGILYTTFHFPENLVNVVTSSECDEDTICPEYKVVAVDVERVSAPLEKTTAESEMVAAK